MFLAYLVRKKVLLTLNSAPMENSAQTESVLSARIVIVLFRSRFRLLLLANGLAVQRGRRAVVRNARQSRVHPERIVLLDLPV